MKDFKNYETDEDLIEIDQEAVEGVEAENVDDISEDDVEALAEKSKKVKKTVTKVAICVVLLFIALIADDFKPYLFMLYGIALVIISIVKLIKFIMNKRVGMDDNKKSDWLVPAASVIVGIFLLSIGINDAISFSNIGIDTLNTLGDGGAYEPVASASKSAYDDYSYAEASADNGVSGSDGASGAMGYAGADGAAAPIGVNGDRGSDGRNGSTGSTGTTGSNGTNGSSSAASEYMSEEGSDSAVDMSQQKLMIITTVNMEAEPDDFHAYDRDIAFRVKKLGGYFESSDVSDQTEEEEEKEPLRDEDGKEIPGYVLKKWNKTVQDGIYVARIPADKLDEFLDGLDNGAKIKSMSSTADDVSLQYLDLDAHIKAIEQEKAKIQELLDKATTIDEILTLNDRVTNLQATLDSQYSQKKFLESKVNYSTVNIHTHKELKTELPSETVKEEEEPEPEPEPEPTFWEKLKFGERFKDGLWDMCDDLVSIIAWIPTVLVPGIILFLIVFIGIKIYFKAEAKAKAKAEEEKKRKAEERKAAKKAAKNDDGKLSEKI